MLAFGLPFFPVLLSIWIIDASDRYLLEVFTTREEVGQYSLAYRIAQVMQIAVAAFSLGWAPLRYKIYERADAGGVYRSLTNYYVLAASLLAVALAVFAREIVSLVCARELRPGRRRAAADRPRLRAVRAVPDDGDRDGGHKAHRADGLDRGRRRAA